MNYPEGILPGHIWPPSSCVFRWWKKRDFSGDSLIRILIPFVRTPSSWLNQLPKAPPPSITTVGFNMWMLKQHIPPVYSWEVDMKFMYLICTIIEVTSKCLRYIGEETLVYTSIQSGFILKNTLQDACMDSSCDHILRTWIAALQVDERRCSTWIRVYPVPQLCPDLQPHGL